MMIQPLDKHDVKTTLVETVMLEIHRRIASQRLASGAKLPSIRQLAVTLQVSKSTVVEGYDRLTAEGVIQARRGAGFFVARSLVPLKLADVGSQLDRDIDPLWVSRQSLEAGRGALKPGCGWLPASWMPQDSIRRALRAMARTEGASLTEYGPPKGFAPLRDLLVRRLADRQIHAQLDQVILTSSGTQTIDLLCRFFLKPGDVVVVDDPCYFNFHALLKAHHVKVVSVAYTATGPDLAQFDRVTREHQPQVYITNSALHNPTGAVLSPIVAHGVLKLAEQRGMIIIEDDIFADMEVTTAPRLAALDGLDRVVSIGSFSKTLSAAARCGYIAARQDWIEGLIDLKIATCFGGDPFAAELTWRVLVDGSYRKYLDGLRGRLSRAMAETCVRLENIGITPWLTPQAGMYLWCELPAGLGAATVARKALVQNILLAPGNVFSLDPQAGRFLRFNVSQSGSPVIYDTLQAIISAKT